MKILDVNDACEHLRKIAGVKIVLYASTTPRIGTYLPLYKEMRNNGYDPIFCVGKKARMPESIIEFLGIGLERIYMMDSDEIGLLAPVDILFCAESEMITPPKSSVNIAIRHSLPDHEGFRFYLGDVLKNWPSLINRFDYFVFPTENGRKNANLESIEAECGGIFPETMLRGRASHIRFVPGGYPKLDLLERIIDSSQNKDCIIYAPTAAGLQYANSKEYGAQILNSLISHFSEHTIVYRPYPGNRITDIEEGLSPGSKFVVDRSPLGEEYLKRACTVVTDYSSFALEFSLASRLPFISCAFKKKGASPVVRDGLCLRVYEIERLVESVRLALAPDAEWRDEIETFCRNFICNSGKSSEYILQKIPVFLNQGSHPDFIEVPRSPFPAEASATDVEEHIAHLRSAWKAGTRSQNVALEEISRTFSSILGTDNQ